MLTMPNSSVAITRLTPSAIGIPAATTLLAVLFVTRAAALAPGSACAGQRCAFAKKPIIEIRDLRVARIRIFGQPNFRAHNIRRCFLRNMLASRSK
jgi:hypothetical protein